MAGEGDYNAVNRAEQGGAVWRIGSGGELIIEGEVNVASGGQLTAAGTQASAIADPTTGDFDTSGIAAIAAIIDALEGVGILAAAT